MINSMQPATMSPTDNADRYAQLKNEY